MTRKTSISEENSLMTPFFFSSYSFAHPTTLLLEILGVGCMGRPLLNFLLLGGPSPSPSISLLSCYQVRSIYFRSQRHPFLAASVNHYSVQPGRAQGVAQETRCGRSNFLLRWLPGNVKDEPAALSLRRLIKRLIRSCFALRCVARSKERKPSNEFLTKRIYGHIIIYEIAVSQTFTKTAIRTYFYDYAARVRLLGSVQRGKEYLVATTFTRIERLFSLFGAFTY